MIQFFARNFRRAYRIPAIIFYLFARGTAALWAFRKKDKNDRCRSARIVTAQTQLWARGLLRLLGVHYTLNGDLKKVDAEGGLLISNHQSYLDILVHAAATGMRFTPNSGIRSWLFFGWYVGLSDPIWIDRSSPRKARKTLEEFRTAIRMDQMALMIYPEGTTTRGDVPLLPFKSTAFETVLGTDMPIQPILTYYKGDRAAGDVRTAWYDDTPFLKHVWGVLGNKRTDVTIHVLPPVQPCAGDDRKILTDRTYGMMNAAHLAFLKEAENV